MHLEPSTVQERLGVTTCRDELDLEGAILVDMHSGAKSAGTESVIRVIVEPDISGAPESLHRMRYLVPGSESSCPRRRPPCGCIEEVVAKSLPAV